MEINDRWPRWFLTRLRSIDLTRSWLARRQGRDAAGGNPTGGARTPNLPADESAALLARVEANNPEAAWALYRTLNPRMQEYVAAHVNTPRWGELVVREVRDKVLRDGVIGERTTPQPDGYSRVLAFKQQTLTCRVCAWRGTGAACMAAAIPATGILEYLCPICTAPMTREQTPTIEEYHAAWDSLSPMERWIVFRMEQVRDAAERRPTP